MTNWTIFKTVQVSVNTLQCGTCGQNGVRILPLPTGQQAVCSNCGQSEIQLRTGQIITVKGNSANSITAINAAASSGSAGASSA